MLVNAGGVKVRAGGAALGGGLIDIRPTTRMSLGRFVLRALRLNCVELSCPCAARRLFSFFCEVRFDLLVRDGGTGVVQRFLHLGAKPRVVGSISFLFPLHNLVWKLSGGDHYAGVED